MNHPQILSTSISSLTPVSSRRRNASLARLCALSVSFASAGLALAQVDQTWNPAGPTNNWSTVAPDLNWDAGTTWVNNNHAIFGGAAETVVVTEPGITFNDLTFSSGYTVAAGLGTLLLGNDAASQITVATRVTGSISETLGDGSGGASSLTKTGAGTLVLSGLNTFSGGFTMSQGVVSISANTALGGAGGTAGAVTLNGGTLRVTTGLSNTHAVTVGPAGGTINVNASQLIFNAANTLLGRGTLTVTGSGSLVSNFGNLRLGAANTFSGNIILQDGGNLEYANAAAVDPAATFMVNNGGELSANAAVANAVTVATGGTLSFQSSGNNSFTNPAITLSGNATVALRDWFNYATVRNGAITSGMGGVGGISVNSGTGAGGTLTLSGANTYTGATVATNSNLTVSGAAGTISGSSSYSLEGGVLTVDHTAGNVDRLKDTAAVTLGMASGLTLTGNATTDTTETVGAVTMTGNATFTVNSASNRVTTLAAASLSRSDFATALVRMAPAPNPALSNTISRFMLADAGTSVPQVGTNTLNNGAFDDATQALKIVPYLIGDLASQGTAGTSSPTTLRSAFGCSSRPSKRC
ncbi:MAG TPA: autotransporter-associated beta strand repeat-containing protein [Chthoniobacteraceae bacterium]|jgi:autotransporter-associated beta strand protein